MELTISLQQPHRRAELFGPSDRFLRRIRDAFQIRISTRNETLRLNGEPGNVAKAAAVIEKLQTTLRGREYLEEADVDRLLDQAALENGAEASETITVFSGAGIAPRTDGQRHYLHALRTNDLVFCVGPAGTGKTYLAVAVAVHWLKVGRAKRIVLARPAVEAGERLGFLPGDLQQKVNPYLRPLFDALHDMMTYEQLKRFTVGDVVEVVPLAYMRGRTLNNAVIILDEAQNTTPTQMLMFLTRLGEHSQMIVTGDDSQIDLEPGQPSGLRDAIRRLKGVKGIDIIRLTRLDIVRHPLVQEVVHRYGAGRGERFDAAQPSSGGQATTDGTESAPGAEASSGPEPQVAD
jgi:phosphate starvation-inducible PhoH-like protein